MTRNPRFISQYMYITKFYSNKIIKHKNSYRNKNIKYQYKVNKLYVLIYKHLIRPIHSRILRK